MRRFLLLITFSALSLFAKAQILNAGFENWSGNSPLNWTNNNDIPTSWFPVTSTTTVHGGLKALNLRAVGSGLTGTGKVTGRFALDSIPQTIHLWARPQFVNANERLRITILVKNGTDSAGYKQFLIYGDTTVYQEYIIPIDTIAGHTFQADSMFIEMKFLDQYGTTTSANLSSKIFVDDMSIVGNFAPPNVATSRSISSARVISMAPNPANTGSTVQLKALNGCNKVRITNMAGQLIKDISLNGNQQFLDIYLDPAIFTSANYLIEVHQYNSVDILKLIVNQ